MTGIVWDTSTQNGIDIFGDGQEVARPSPEQRRANTLLVVTLRNAMPGLLDDLELLANPTTPIDDVRMVAAQALRRLQPVYEPSP